MGNAPFHIAIIPDGNRRFAKRLMKSPWKGHEWGMEKLKKVFEWAKGTGVKMITFYSLSLENIKKRPSEEINFLYDLSRKEMKNILETDESFIHKYRIRINFFGKFKVLPEDIQELIKRVEDATKAYSEYYLNVAIAYGGRQEVEDAVKSIVKQALEGRIDVNDINEERIMQSLYTRGIPDPDLIIRTGGEKRLSNFLPMQSIYSELVFINTLWPEFSREEFVDALEEYARRKRRFGA